MVEATSAEYDLFYDQPHIVRAFVANKLTIFAEDVSCRGAMLLA